VEGQLVKVELWRTDAKRRGSTFHVKLKKLPAGDPNFRSIEIAETGY
jgi:hypothetical protein